MAGLIVRGVQGPDFVTISPLTAYLVRASDGKSFVADYSPYPTFDIDRQLLRPQNHRILTLDPAWGEEHIVCYRVRMMVMALGSFHGLYWGSGTPFGEFEWIEVAARNDTSKLIELCRRWFAEADESKQEDLGRYLRCIDNPVLKDWVDGHQRDQHEQNTHDHL